MGCSNCFNNCAEITSDQCVRYTGLDISALGIENGDSLAVVTKSITDFIATAIDGTGIAPTVSSGDICSTVSAYLPSSGTITLNDYLTAIIKTACTLQISIDNNQNTLDALNNTYSIGSCITVNDNTDTHEILQAVVTKLCSIDSSLTSLIASLPTTYVKLTDLNTLISNYLSSVSTTGSMAEKMVPYVAVEYYGPLSGYPSASDGFSASGAGYGAWQDVYLCNGSNNTPDRRGRVGVGVTDGSMGGGAMDSAVDPASGNPNFSLEDVSHGETSVILTSINQIPSHTHTATPTLVLANHFHYVAAVGGNQKSITSSTPVKSIGDVSGAQYPDYNLQGTDTSTATVGKTSSSKSTVDTLSVAISSVGGTESHNNVQPSIGCYYIMYIP